MPSASRSPSPPTVTFAKKKNRGAAARATRPINDTSSTSTSTSASTSQPTSNTSNLTKDDPEDDEPTIVVRTKGIGGKKAANKEKPKPIKKGLSFRDDQEQEEGSDSIFEVKKSKLSLASKASRSTATSSSSNLPSSLSQASISNDVPTSSYSASALAALKAATPSASTARRQTSPSSNLNSACMELDDPMTEEDLTRNKFGNDYTHSIDETSIPDAASIRSAKEKRAKAAASGGGQNSEDFISLASGGGSSKKSSSKSMTILDDSSSSDRYQGPHPESRLQREEDDLGSGEDEFDQYTGASERIGLGKSAEKEREKRRKQEIREAIGEEDEDDPITSQNGYPDGDQDQDEEEMEWERSQMDRWSLPGERQRREKREKSPYVPAVIPLTSPLPTINSTSSRLEARLKLLNQSKENHRKVVEDSESSMKQMEEEEKDNKEQVQREGEKEAWFREFEEWAISVAGFLDEKLPPFEEIESDFVQLLSQRTRLSQLARGKDAEDELSLFHGVPSISLIPFVPKNGTENGNANGHSNEVDVPPKPIEDGDALSSIRENRRIIASNSQPSTENEYLLSPPDLSSFLSERNSLSSKLVNLFSNVQASVFRDPAARVSSASSSLNPSSIAARFSNWRSQYPQEYTGAWGGLALAGVWEFWARWEMLEWDPLRSSAPRNSQNEIEISSKAGPRGLDGFKWHSDLTLYTERHLSTSAESNQDQDEDVQQIGGDDEAVATMVSNLVVPKLCSIAEKGGYDPWSFRDTRAILSLVEEVSYVLERDGWRFQSLIIAYLSTFRPQINTILQVLSSEPASPPPGFHPASITARVSFLRRLVTLLRNFISWNRYLPESEKVGYADLVDQLVGRGMWNLIRESKMEGGSEIAKEVLSIVPPNLLAADLKSRLESLF